MGPNENQYAILDEDKTSLTLYFLQREVTPGAGENNGAIDPKIFADTKAVPDPKVAPDRSPLQFLFETEVDRIFFSPLGNLYKFIIALTVPSKIFL